MPVSKTLVVVISGLVILAFFLIIVIAKSYGVGIPVFQTVYDYLSNALKNIPFLTGNMTEWPAWAR
jgi:hypothetical protein